MRAGEVIYEDGAQVTHAVFPEQGVVAIMAEMRDGRSVHQASVGHEGFVGYAIVLGGGTAIGRSVVLVAGEATWVPISTFDQALLRFVSVRESILRYGQAHTIELMQLVACNSLHTADQRLSRWLLQTSDRVGAASFYMTQDVMAKTLGLRRATVNMICGELMEAGAIDYTRGNLTVTDRAELEARSCECYGRIRLAYAFRNHQYGMP
ncbi:MAG: Crp/Fnr family transcriptional regulator [Mesorhizobium sp.]